MGFISDLFSTKLIILYIFIISACYIQFRGKIRLKFTRQFINHSTFAAPINCLYYLFSSIPNQPFIDKSRFPELNLLNDNWQIIRDEAMLLLQNDYIKTADNNDDIGFNSFFKRGWRRFYLKWYQDCHPSAQKLCPKTLELLNQIPYLKGAMFTLLPPEGKIKPHRDPYAGSLRYHLGLITPNSDECAILVDGQPYSWRDGEAVMFDETFVHSAYNKTDQQRLILFCDIERPLNNPFIRVLNRFIARYVMSATSSPNFGEDKTGKINMAYKYIHQLKTGVQLIKRKNRYVYGGLKYALVLGGIYWIVLS